MANLTADEKTFLERIVPFMGRWTPASAIPWSNRASDRARQSLKRRGFVIFSPNKAPKNYSRWQATADGRAALQEAASDAQP